MNQQIRDKFKTLFGAEPAMYFAPGRVNLIGEHTDYNCGFVLPAAVDKQIVFAVKPNSVGRFRFFSFDLGESFETEEDNIRKSDTAWANYLLGVVAQFRKVGLTVPAFDCVFGGNVPLGAGMSSSAAIEEVRDGLCTGGKTRTDIGAVHDSTNGEDCCKAGFLFDVFHFCSPHSSLDCR